MHRWRNAPETRAVSVRGDDIPVLDDLDRAGDRFADRPGRVGVAILADLEDLLLDVLDEILEPFLRVVVAALEGLDSSFSQADRHVENISMSANTIFFFSIMFFCCFLLYIKWWQF